MTRGRQPGFRMSYVYRIFDGLETVYIGKGSGRRLKQQMRSFGMSGEIIEECNSDDHAFERERHWIKTLMPTANISPGGAGGRTKPKEMTREEKRAAKDYSNFMKEYNELGSRRWTARALLRMLNLNNCEAHGISKVGLSRILGVANGPRC